MSDSWDRDEPPNAKLGSIAAEIYQLLADSEEGLDIGEIRRALGVGEDQEHLDRRIRSLRKYYHLSGTQEGSRYVYRLEGPRPVELGDSGHISGKLRATVLHQAKGRCQMCGKTIADDGIRLQIDHKIPQNWGGMTVYENLWALCESCNNGKRDYFSSFDEEEMAEIMTIESVHERLAKLLKLHLGKPVESSLLEFAANVIDRQDDWQKRLRELRYPPIGLNITVGKRKNEHGQVETTYTLNNWIDLPVNHKRLIRDWDNGKR